MRRLSATSIWKYAASGAGIAVALIFGLILLSALGPGLNRLVRTAARGVTSRIISVSTPTPVIVEQLQSLNRLETARQISQHNVEARSEGLPLPDFLAGDRLLMTVQTEVIAGVDLAKVTGESIRADGGVLTLVLPAPEIFNVMIDENSSKVFSRERGWLVFRPDPDLERQARLRAHEDALTAANRGEVLKAARSNAELNLRSLLEPAGYDRILITWEDAEGTRT